MAQSLVLKTRVKQLSNTTGSTGNLTFSGTVTSFRSFAADIADGVPFPYVAKGATASEWEEGIGELASGGTQLVRRVTASSNGNDAVSFTTGPIEIVLSRHAAIIGNECIWGTGEDGAITVTGSNMNLTDDLHATSITWSGSGKINCNGFKVYCIGETNLTSAPAGGINNDASGVTGGGWGTVGGGCNGAMLVSTFGSGPDAAAPPVPVLLGGKAGEVGSGTSDQSGRNAQLCKRLPMLAETAGLPAGGGGNVDASASALPGGGGGVAQLQTRRLRRTSGSGTGALRANGAAGTVGTCSGGGGGRFRLIYGELLGSSKTDLIQCNGGDGNSADGGDGGAIETYNFATGASTFTAGTTTTTSTAGTCTLTV
jgi:hypothetical protein